MGCDRLIGEDMAMARQEENAARMLTGGICCQERHRKACRKPSRDEPKREGLGPISKTEIPLRLLQRERAEGLGDKWRAGLDVYTQPCNIQNKGSRRTGE